jgi:Ca2+-binding RTX toxin-like protein
MADIPGDITSKAVLDEVNGPAQATFSGELETAGDHDFIQVFLFNGVTYEFFLSFLETGSLTNGNANLVLRDSTGAIVASDDDGGVGQNSLLSFVGTSEVFFLDIGASGDNSVGSYSLGALSAAVGEVLAPLSDGNDDYTGLANERILGGKGADRIDIGAGVDGFGEQGNDILIGNSANNKLYGGLGNDTVNGGGGTDSIFGDAGDDDLFGGGGASDSIRGGPGNDHLFGEDGIDFLHGQLGKDFLTGGPDNDFFRLQKVTDSPRGPGRDVIFDFSQAEGDTIDLSDVDAKKGGADNQFRFIGTAAFHDRPGELRFVKINSAGTSNDKTIVEGDVNGDGKADFQIQVNGLHNLTVDDFDL